ncbi:MAG: hypothetical protein M0P61_01935 [Ignavibacteriaceae bacterium]|nr:hypothetical protein [Ignavibacteriaceae bacterium]
MKNLFLIDGASGTGKSDLLKHIVNTRKDASILRKYSTRKIREYEKRDDIKLDLDFVSKDKFEKANLDYVYTYYGNQYGFSKNELKKMLIEKSNVFVIVRNADTIKQLINDYYYINVVPIFVYTDQEKLKIRLINQDYSETDIAERLKKTGLAYEDYLRHPDIYDEILINNSTKEDYHRLIDLIIDRYKKLPEIDDKLIFVLMSFNPNNPELKKVFLAIQKSVEIYDKSYKCYNLESLKGKSYKISDTAKEHISKCRLAIIDLTENKPNVFYELGYASGISKDFIINAHKDTQLLFYPRE